MSYIQNNLQAGEEIKYKADIHWYIFVLPTVLLLLGAFLSSAQTSFIYYIGLLLLLLGLFQLIKRVLLKMGAEYVITNKKVILKSGILSRDALELILSKCEGLRINQSIMGRILGFGSIVVTTGGATNTFKFIANPIKFRNEINAQINSI
uniref:PH domain-containing protein n=1 Tax=uncultured Bacteroides sp. TaxID=162156 RepID=UPI0025DD682F|nr:PH domain-containing protein [uncultured Bacteroides sp.]